MSLPINRKAQFEASTNKNMIYNTTGKKIPQNNFSEIGKQLQTI